MYHGCLDHRIKARKLTEWMIEGERDEKRASRNISTGLLFASPIPRDFEAKKAFTNPQLEASLNVIRKYDEDRLLTGINPSTLLTEYRRKVVIKSLLSLVDRSESPMPKSFRNIGNDADDIVTIYEDIKDDIDQYSYNSLADTLGRLPRKHEDIHRADAISIRSGKTDKSNEFIASWKDYDAMKTRWLYMKPQVKKLVDENSLMLPHQSSEMSITEDSKTLFGNYSDISTYKKKKEMDRPKAR